MSWKTVRQSQMMIGNFKWDSDILTFDIKTKLPQLAGEFYMPVCAPQYLFKLSMLPCVATSFPDFCWRVSHGTTPENVGQVQVKIAETIDNRPVKIGDLSWVLPSKFTDDLIEVMATLNNTIFDSILDESLLYGPL